MVTDGRQFFKRTLLIMKELHADTYPNTTSLAKLLKCSKNTAQRTLYRLRDELNVPLDYNSSKKGYYLTNKNFRMPDQIPAGKDELTALLIMRDFTGLLDAEDLRNGLDTLWHQFAVGNPRLGPELEPVAKIFSCDSTVIGKIADQGVLDYVTAAASGEHVKISYKSPWRHSEPREYRGRILRVHFSDGNLYILFRSTEKREIVLNAAFVKSFEILDSDLIFDTASSSEEKAENWLEGFGIWAGTDLTDIEVSIHPPAAEYYAAQVWDESQEDRWDGDVLVRRLQGIVSPEIVRRVLSLGKYIKDIKPDNLKALAVENAKILIRNLEH